MKAIKITKRLLNKNPSDLLIELGAVNQEKTIAYPQHVYFSKQDYAALTSAVKKKFRKYYPGINKNQLELAVGMELFSYGPNQNVETALKKGYALIDLESIKEEQKKSDKE